MLTTLAATVVVALLAAPTPAQSRSPWLTVDSTSYSPCSSGTITASGKHTYFGEVAMNTLPLGTRIEITPAAFGRSTFTVEDRIGSGSQLDIFQPSCAAAIAYGRETEHVRILGNVHHSGGLSTSPVRQCDPSRRAPPPRTSTSVLPYPAVPFAIQKGRASEDDSFDS